MADRIAPIRKTPTEILVDLLQGHEEAVRYGGAEKGRKYLQNFIGQANSIPNAVKFYLFDLLAEDAFQAEDHATCRHAVERAREYLAAAQEETPPQFRAYTPSIRFFERGVALALDEGEFEQALAWCDQALALGLGKAYEAKRASIARML
jgi:hypothetical protein